jgi:hypothetical protein
MTEFVKEEKENVVMMILEEPEEYDSTETQFQMDYEVDGEPIDLRLLPQEIMYNQLGADWIADRHGIEDPFLYKICEKVAEQGFKSLSEQWEEQKLRKIDNYIEIKNEVVYKEHEPLKSNFVREGEETSR